MVLITLADISSNEGAIIGKLDSAEELSDMVDSTSLLIVSISVGADGGISCVAFSIAVGRSLPSVCDD